MGRRLRSHERGAVSPCSSRRGGQSSSMLREHPACQPQLFVNGGTLRDVAVCREYTLLRSVPNVSSMTLGSLAPSLRSQNGAWGIGASRFRGPLVVAHRAYPLRDDLFPLVLDSSEAGADTVVNRAVIVFSQSRRRNAIASFV